MYLIFLNKTYRLCLVQKNLKKNEKKRKYKGKKKKKKKWKKIKNRLKVDKLFFLLL